MINFDGSISFDDRNRLPQEAGVYFLCDTSGSILYVGRSVNLRRRWRMHHRQTPASEVEGLQIKWQLAGVDVLEELEHHYIESLKPEWNSTLKGRTKTHQPLYLDPEAAATLQQLAAAVGANNQRGQASISALCEWLADVATAAWPETVAALRIAEASSSGDWYELIEAIAPEYQKEKHMSHGWSGVYEAIGLNVEDTDMHEEARGLLERSTIEEEEGVFLVGNVRDNDSQARRLVELLTGLCAECDVQATFRLARKHTD